MAPSQIRQFRQADNAISARTAFLRQSESRDVGQNNELHSPLLALPHYLNASRTCTSTAVSALLLPCRAWTDKASRQGCHSVLTAKASSFCKRAMVTTHHSSASSCRRCSKRRRAPTSPFHYRTERNVASLGRVLTSSARSPRPAPEKTDRQASIAVSYDGARGERPPVQLSLLDFQTQIYSQLL